MPIAASTCLRPERDNHVWTGDFAQTVSVDAALEELVTVLRIAFFLPALADFLLAGLTVTRLLGVEDESIVPRLQFSSVAFAWGILLLFAMARPIERAWVLVPTALAVAGVSSAICLGFFDGAVGGASALLAALAAVIIFGFGYAGLRFAQNAASQSESPAEP